MKRVLSRHGSALLRALVASLGCRTGLGIWLVACLFGVAHCNNGGDTSADGGEDDGGEASPCPWDEDDAPASAGTATLSGNVEGYLCPTGDQDWYRFTVPAGVDLLTVSLSIEAPVSPVDATYSVWAANAQDVVAGPASNEAALPNQPLAIVHGINPGEYYLTVRDRANDAQDVRHPYQLALTGAADLDANEPNNSAESATPAGATPLSGYISYRGDRDWYKVELTDHQLLDLQLTMPVGGIEPTYEILDSAMDVLMTDTNEAGKFEATALAYVQSVETAGTYYIAVFDDDDLHHDSAQPYQLTIGVHNDPDQNETNDTPAQATELGTLTCGADWTEWPSTTAYVASLSDIDWYKIHTAGCAGGVLELEITFESLATLPQNLQAAARMIRQTPGAPCTTDQECQTLPIACDSNLDCSKFGNVCLSTGQCAGAGVCLPSGVCGATVLVESAPQSPSNPQPGVLAFGTPVFGLTPLYFAVSDFQSDAYSLNNAYTIRGRVRVDPDTHERNEVYTGGPPGPTDSVSAHQAHAVEVPVHNCTDEADGGPECCDDTTWVQGRLSYTYDQDWYKYVHPCPAQDCMVKVQYDFDPGPTDYYMQIYRGGSSWFDNLSDTVDLVSQPAKTGYFGGVDAEDYCFYAYHGHDGDPFWYYLPVRDTVFRSENGQEDGTWDWSAEQVYRFCVEKVANECLEPPCQIYGDAGCGAPEDD